MAELKKEIKNYSPVTTPGDNDNLVVQQAADSVVRRWTWTSIKATLKTYFDTLYTAIPPSSAQGDILYRDATGWVRLPAGTSGYFLKTQGASANPVWANNKMTKVGGFTRDISLIGTQAITGVGFSPKAIIFFASVAGAKAMSVGFVDTTGAGTGRGIVDYGVQTPDTYFPFSYAIGKLYAGAGTDGAYADLNSMDSDGFTLNWAKDGSPTGTVTVQYLAIG